MPALLIAVVIMATPSFAQDSAVPYSGDQRRFLSVTQSLEAAPLDARLRADRAWAMQWLIDAPDISVTACLEPIGGTSIKGFDHSTDIIAQYTLSMAVFIIRHPELKNDVAAQQIAGVESALRSYKAMRNTKASAKSPSLEALLEKQRRGELSDAVHKAYLQCSAHPIEEMSATDDPPEAVTWEKIWAQPRVVTIYANRTSVVGTEEIRSLTTKAEYREPLPEGYISERIRVEEFDCRQHRSRARRSIIFGHDGRAPQMVEWTAEEAVWTSTKAGSLGRTKEDLACAVTSK